MACMPLLSTFVIFKNFVNMGIKKIFSLVVMSLCLSSVQAQDEKKVGKVQENQRGAD